MKKILLLLCVLSLASSSWVFANRLNFHEMDIQSRFETDKKVYAPGEKVHVVLHVQNSSEDFIFRPDYQYDPELDNVNVEVNLKAKDGLHLSNKVGELSDNLSMVVPPQHTRPYFSFSFDLVDRDGVPLPEGEYVLSHDGLVFLTGSFDTSRYVTVGGPHGQFGYADNAIFYKGNLSDHVIFVSADSPESAETKIT